MKDAIELIKQERQRQEKKGYTLTHDIEFNNHFQLSQAIQFLSKVTIEDDEIEQNKPLDWHETAWERVCSHTYSERLIIVGAWAVAEYNRLQAEAHRRERLDTEFEILGTGIQSILIQT